MIIDWCTLQRSIQSEKGEDDDEQHCFGDHDCLDTKRVSGELYIQLKENILEMMCVRYAWK